MIVGLGVDLVEVSRISRALKSPRFIERILTPAEREEPLSAERVAGRWAAKEAVAKAVGVFLRWHDVEIHNLATGAPVATVSPDVYKMDDLFLHISISHVKGNAVAVAILERA